MRVICIKSGNWVDDDGVIDNNFSPRFGEPCTAVGEDDSSVYYLLSEYPLDGYGRKQYFGKKNFIPLSNIDEKELLEERELQLQNA